MVNSLKASSMLSNATYAESEFAVVSVDYADLTCDIKAAKQKALSISIHAPSILDSPQRRM